MTETTAHTSHTNNGLDHTDIRDRAKDFADNAAEKVEETTEAVREKGDLALLEARIQIDTAQRSVREAVRKNPTTMLLGAVGVGVLLGMALRGRN